MFTYDHVILGGGAAGVGALDELLTEHRSSSLILLEARRQLGYTLTWMGSLSYRSERFERDFTGLDFLDFLVHKKNPSRDLHVQYLSRAFFIDTEKKIVHYISADKDHEQIGYRHLVCAPGAVQILYGRHLLPGKRTARLFTTYQIGEMLSHYTYLPGKKLVFYGSSPYTVETAALALAQGLSPIVVSPEEIGDELIAHIPTLPIYQKSLLLRIEGDTRFRSLVIEYRGKTQSISGDALVVDGDFVLERQWREQLKVEWDLEQWRLKDEGVNKHNGSLRVVGDAKSPDHNFIAQYERAREALHSSFDTEVSTSRSEKK